MREKGSEKEEQATWSKEEGEDVATMAAVDTGRRRQKKSSETTCEDDGEKNDMGRRRQLQSRETTLTDGGNRREQTTAARE